MTFMKGTCSHFLLCTWRSKASELCYMIIGFRRGKGGKQPLEIGEKMKEFIFLGTIITANPKQKGHCGPVSFRFVSLLLFCSIFHILMFRSFHLLGIIRFHLHSEQFRDRDWQVEPYRTKLEFDFGDRTFFCFLYKKTKDAYNLKKKHLT